MPARELNGRFAPVKTKGSFAHNMDVLIARLKGDVVGSVEVNQVYAHYQHAHPEFHHPDGGEAFYLQTPLFLKAHDYMRMLAEKMITHDGTDIEGGMKDVVEDLSREVYDRAPWEFGDLRGSGHPKVTHDGETTYDRPPNVARLSADELKEKEHLRYLFDKNRYRK